MAKKYLSDFKEYFSATTPFEVDVEINGNVNTVKYTELSSAEEATVRDEFEEWFKANYGKETREREVSLQQYRYYKMLAKHAAGLDTFEDFLRIPRVVISAFATAIEEDMLQRYPHLKKQLEYAMGGLKGA